MVSLNEDASKIERLYLLYEQSMFREARAILREDHLAEDAVHEAFLRLVRKRDGLDDPESDKTRAYIRKVLRSTAIDIYRKNRRDRDNCCSYEDNESIIAKDSTVFDDTVCLIEDLPPKYASVIRCIALHRLSAKEAAAVLRISEACVRKRYERAKKMLRDTIEGKGKKTIYIERKESKR